jgi:hypothetical protein
MTLGQFTNEYLAQQHRGSGSHSPEPYTVAFAYAEHIGHPQPERVAGQLVRAVMYLLPH